VSPSDELAVRLRRLEQQIRSFKELHTSEVSDLAQRTSLYRQAVDKFAFSRRNILYLYHLNYIVSHPKSLKGYKAVPDGLIRIKGVSWQ